MWNKRGASLRRVSFGDRQTVSPARAFSATRPASTARPRHIGERGRTLKFPLSTARRPHNSRRHARLSASHYGLSCAAPPPCRHPCQRPLCAALTHALVVVRRPPSASHDQEDRHHADVLGDDGGLFFCSRRGLHVPLALSHMPGQWLVLHQQRRLDCVGERLRPMLRLRELHGRFLRRPPRIMYCRAQL